MKMLLCTVILIYSSSLIGMRMPTQYKSEKTNKLQNLLVGAGQSTPINETEVKQLILEGGNPNATLTDTTWLLLYVMRPGDLFSFLLEHGANPNKSDESSQTPLHKAAYHGIYVKAVQLIEAGANIHRIDNQGNSPLMEAVKNNQPKIVQLLLEKGAATEIEVRNSAGESPLSLARARKMQNLITLLESFLPTKK